MALFFDLPQAISAVDSRSFGCKFSPWSTAFLRDVCHPECVQCAGRVRLRGRFAR